ncbi:MAG: undecaprenyl-diphosphate phosphatase [Gemmatimonadetes bacterium]|nr:undecaprenyl-diphosphate phosphatase [Gemmatimonadota bacterium]
MSWWQGVVLGVVQGLTEFLPVSSSGHLVVAERALGVPRQGVVVEVALHVATLAAVLLVYRKRIWGLLAGLTRNDGSAWRYVALLGLATVPAGLAGVVLGDWFERAFNSLGVVGLDFLLTGAILWSTRRTAGRAAVSEPSWRGAGGIGLAQAFAILPGISRSGSTVAAALWVGVRPTQAAEFSFLMSIPVITGAAVLELPKLGGETFGVGAGPLVASFVAALLAGIAAIKLLVRLLERGAFHRFAPYCWALGAATLAWALRG